MDSPPPLAAPAAGYRGTVLSGADGDTHRVQASDRSITIRLACIDAPETAQSPWGMQSRADLQQRLPHGRQGKSFLTPPTATAAPWRK